MKKLKIQGIRVLGEMKKKKNKRRLVQKLRSIEDLGTNFRYEK